MLELYIFSSFTFAFSFAAVTALLDFLKYLAKLLPLISIRSPSNRNPKYCNGLCLISSFIKSKHWLLNISDDYVKPSVDYIFTSDLKSLSGAIFHKIVFCFQLAYIEILKKYLNINIPIILDSPRGKEVDEKNIAEMLNILKRDFSNHQVIISSIYKYDFPEMKIFEIKNNLLEDSFL